MPSQLANRLCYTNYIDLQFPTNFKKMNKMYNETQEAIGSLKRRDLLNKSKITLVEDVFGFLPGIFSSNNSFFIRDIIKEIGFEINGEVIVPEISRVIRLPQWFGLNQAVNEEKKNENPGRNYQEFTNKKRKRNFAQGPIFIFNEGLTNAVKRRVKIGDLL